MADQLAIDLDGIEGWGAALQNVRSGLAENVAPGAGGSTIGADTSSSIVENALGDFDRSWATGRQIIDSYMKALSDMCDKTAETIRATDSALARPPAGHNHRMDMY